MAQPPNRLPTPAPGAFEYAAIIPHAPLYNNNPGAGGPTITIPHLPNVYAQYLPMSGPVVDGPDMTIRLQQAMNWLGAAHSANETILRHVGLIVPADQYNGIMGFVYSQAVYVALCLTMAKQCLTT